jgi:hypothetical protein
VWFHKKRVKTCYAELLFLHPEGSAGHVVHFGVSRVRNIDALFFMLGWKRYGFDKSVSGHVTLNFYFCIQGDLRVPYLIPVRLGFKTSSHYFSCLGGIDRHSTKAHRETLCRTCAFPSGGIWGSCGAFRCDWGAKHQRNIFHV